MSVEHQSAKKGNFSSSDKTALSSNLEQEAGVGTAQQTTTHPDEALRERIEHETLVSIFRDVRAQSARGELVTPQRWKECGIVPEHMTTEDLEMVVYDYLQEHTVSTEEVEAEQPTYRSATRCVGIPRAFDPSFQKTDSTEVTGEETSSARSVAQAEVIDSSDAREPDSVESTNVGIREVESRVVFNPLEEDKEMFEEDLNSEFEPFEITVDGVQGVVQLVDGQPAFVPYEPGEKPYEEIDCTHIKLLQGHACYYLYANNIMTDTFANWAFMAAENDDAATLATLVREESRVYPRPFLARSLENSPFSFSAERIEEAWQAVCNSQSCADIEELHASNGDRYFFSTEHLSRAYAESLAEWASVERYQNV